MIDLVCEVSQRSRLTITRHPLLLAAAGKEHLGPMIVISYNLNFLLAHNRAELSGDQYWIALSNDLGGESGAWER